MEGALVRLLRLSDASTGHTSNYVHLNVRVIGVSKVAIAKITLKVTQRY